MAIKGSCQCGAVVYEIDRLDGDIVHCHCRTCRKSHAASFAPTAVVLRQHFRFLEGEDKLTSHHTSADKVRRFCSVCGCHIVAERAFEPHIRLRVASLDGHPGAAATLHIWQSHEPEWLADRADTRRYQEMPDDPAFDG